ncbi:hypothetical protein F4677DRAFT_273603 [Hypoxylon crocopeplum]|nr:hypothetical protein F4677DRAFT_273603 [Hypoxylon crocopeplum]
MENPSLPPMHGIGLALFIISIVLLVISVAVVCLRVYIRWFEGSFWWDDGLMFGGLIMYTVLVGIACRSTYYGLGFRSANLTEAQQAEATKFMTIWTLFYAACLVFIKTSICMTMLRLTVTMKYIRFAVYALLALCVVSFLVLFVGTVAVCRPIEANWDYQLLAEGKAVCGSEEGRMGISYTSTITTIITDIACAILPAIILWRTQLKLKTKLLVSLLLSFGSFASVCTMIRTPYIKYYHAEDLVYWVAYVTLWSHLESGIGLIAGSVPVLQKLIMSRVKKATSHATPTLPDIVTYGSVPPKVLANRAVFRNPTDTGFSVASVHANRRSRDWERLEDDSSLQGIRADYTYEVELSQVAPASQSELVKK